MFVEVESAFLVGANSQEPFKRKSASGTALQEGRATERGSAAGDGSASGNQN